MEDKASGWCGRMFGRMFNEAAPENTRLDMTAGRVPALSIGIAIKKGQDIKKTRHGEVGLQGVHTGWH